MVRGHDDFLFMVAVLLFGGFNTVFVFFCRVIRQQQEIDDLAAKQASDTSMF